MNTLVNENHLRCNELRMDSAVHVGKRPGITLQYILRMGQRLHLSGKGLSGNNIFEKRDFEKVSKELSKGSFHGRKHPGMDNVLVEAGRKWGIIIISKWVQQFVVWQSSHIYSFRLVQNLELFAFKVNIFYMLCREA